MEHTPKNILIRAVKRPAADAGMEEKASNLKSCMDFLGVSPCLDRLLNMEPSEERN
jgi:hypothetical protein